MDRQEDFGTLRAWNGYWRLPNRSELTDGLYSIGQYTAKQLLQAGAPRNQWEGDFLQAVLVQTKPLGPAQSYWLDRLVREYSEREAA